MESKTQKFTFVFKAVRAMVDFFYPSTQIKGLENLPDSPSIIVGNHAQMHGPIVCELYLPDNFYTWCAGEMMNLKDVPTYAFNDFWANKPPYIRWFFRLLSFIIAPLSVVIFNNARTISVYHDSRLLSTFRTTVSHLAEGRSIVIFPEHNEPNNRIINHFQTHFVDVAKPYLRKTGKAVSFVPAYLAPDLKTMYLGKPTEFCPQNPIDEERTRICQYLSEQITEIACGLPRHRVVPYGNVPKKNYPYNK